jgi:UDP-GlcNAc:undecaprenyl-phosphate GlcNAc-1-phosphate transferase
MLNNIPGFVSTVFLTTILLIILLKNFGLRKNILIRNSVPFIGGISMGISIFLACVLYGSIFMRIPLYIQGILIGSGLMLIFGIIDDSREMSVAKKVLAQSIATAVLVLFGVRTYIIYIGTPLNILITFIWVLGITNAFNLLDVMDGLAGSIAIIASLSFCAISILNQDFLIAILALGIVGAASGFLLFNLPPAKVYMGNAGSHFLGFMLAAIALSVHYANLETKLALLAPILILGFPIFDTLFLIFMRIRKGQPAFNKSNDHLALRFLKAGYSKKSALMFMIALTVIFAACGVAMVGLHSLKALLPLTLAIIISLATAKKLSGIKVDG